MMPGDLIVFLFIGACMFMVIAIVAFIFRKRKKVVLMISSLLIVSYIAYFFAFPSIQNYKHKKSYNVLVEYLLENYRGQQFTVVPNEYELGIAAGDFFINDVRTPSRGVVMRVKENKEVVQLSTWSNPVRQQVDVWQELLLHYKETYRLDQPLDKIQKLADYEDGRFTVFGLKVDENLALAVYDYFEGGYELKWMEEFPMEDVIHTIHEDKLIVFVTSENIEPIITVTLNNGNQRTINVIPQRAQIIVENL